MTRGERLALLIEEQAQDDASDRPWPWTREANETDLSTFSGNEIDFERLPDPAAAPALDAIERESFIQRAKPVMDPPVRLIGIGVIGARRAVSYDPVRDRCPACGDQQLPRLHFCCVCSRSWVDPKPHPQQARATEKPTGQRQKLRGGKGKLGAWADYRSPGLVGPG